MKRLFLAPAEERREAAGGAWPETFDGTEIPVCPASGLPLGLGKGSFWSAGKDGDDDQGRPTPGNDLEEANGDFVWTIRRR